MQGKHFFAIVAAAAILPAPVLAGPPVKKPVCQTGKVATRDAKRPEPCRRPIPPVIDPSPLFLAATAASPAVLSDLT